MNDRRPNLNEAMFTVGRLENSKHRQSGQGVEEGGTGPGGRDQQVAGSAGLSRASLPDISRRDLVLLTFPLRHLLMSVPSPRCLQRTSL